MSRSERPRDSRLGRYALASLAAAGILTLTAYLPLPVGNRYRYTGPTQEVTIRPEETIGHFIDRIYVQNDEPDYVAGTPPTEVEMAEVLGPMNRISSHPGLTSVSGGELTAPDTLGARDPDNWQTYKPTMSEAFKEMFPNVRSSTDIP